MLISGIGLSNASYNSNTRLSKNFLNNKGKLKQHDVEDKNNTARNNLGIALGGKKNKNSILENLMKQKEKLTESKTNLIEKSLEKGNDPISIKEKLEVIDKQIEEIDKRINNIKLEEQRKALGTEDKSKKREDSKQKANSDFNKDEQKDSSMDGILDISVNFSKAKTLSSQKNTMISDSNILETEIKLDRGRSITPFDPVRKKEQLSKMKDKIEDISEKFGEYLKDANTKSSKNAESKNTSTSAKSENKDKLLIKQQQAEKNIKHYIDNQEYNAKDNSEKFNIIA